MCAPPPPRTCIHERSSCCPCHSACRTATSVARADHKVSKELSSRVRSYYDYLWACGHNTNEETLFRELPEKVRMQLAMNKKKPLIRGVDMFQNVSAQCTVAIVEALVPVIMLPREYVMVQEQVGDEMFFINRGLVQVTQFVNMQERAVRRHA